MSAALAKPRPHEEAAAETLRTAALALYPELRNRVAETANAVTALRQCPLDAVLMLAAADAFSLAASSLADSAKRLHEAADEALLATMDGTGCTGFATAAGFVGRRINPPTVEITDTAAVPEHFMVPRDPAPDRTAMRKYLQAHPTANWGRLVGGSTSLVRRSS